ncbi:hypothetical protein WJX81_005162 [Elliptochloris bilobata]|uniref:CsbD-like domain-containing protein n=1 Tax=Elliptochloris bilobata TaxID=381761 RepID=A0AAW1R2D4_9CHLO
MTGGEPSKVGGKVDAAIGTVKENAGKLVGAHQTEGEGAAQRAHGNAEHDTAKAKGYVEGASDSLVGGIKKNVGKLFGNSETEAKGTVQEKRGDAGKMANS